MTKKLTPQEVMVLLQRIGEGKMEPRLARPADAQDRFRWWAEILFDVHGWRVEWIFRGGHVSYLDKVVAPDGRVWSYDDTIFEGRDRPPEKEYPELLLFLADPACFSRMNRAFLAAV